MAHTYGWVNLFSSLGFAYLWRKQCVESIPSNATKIADLMAGGGECLKHIQSHFGSESHIDLIDWSSEMCKKATQTIKKSSATNCLVHQSNALELPFENSTYDSVISTFGLKTFEKEEVKNLCSEISRILKERGHYSVLEFSIPQNSLIKIFFRIYVQYWVPFLGWLFLGNPDNYRMLWKYTHEFQNCSSVFDHFKDAGLNPKFKSHFFGSATQIYGFKKSLDP